MITRNAFYFSHTVVLISGFAGSILSASAPSRIVVPQNPFNTFAQKIYKAQEKKDKITEDVAAEFKKLFEDQTEKVFDKKPQCKTELELLLADFDAQVKVQTIERVRNERLEAMKKNIAKIAAAQQTGMPIEERPSVAQMMADIRKKQEQKKAQKVKKEKFELHEEEPIEQQVSYGPEPKPTQGLPVGPQLTTPFTQSPKVSEVVQQPEVKPEKKTEITVIPAVVDESLKALTEFIYQPKVEEPVVKVSQVKEPEQQELTVAVATPLNKAITILQERAQLSEEPQKIRIEKVSKQIQATVAELPLSQQLPVAIATNQMVGVAAVEGAPAVAREALPLIAATQLAIVPINNFEKIVKDNGLAPAGSAEGIKLTDLSKLVFDMTHTTQLGNRQQIDLLVAAVTGAISTMESHNTLIAPAVTGALVLAPDNDTQQAVYRSLYELLKTFDALIYGAKQKIYDEPTSITKQLDNRLTAWVPFLYPALKESATQLISAYAMLSTVGISLIHSIEAYVKQYSPVISPAIMHKWNAGEIGILQEVSGLKSGEKKEISNNHKRNYRKELADELKRLRESIEKAIYAIAPEEEQELLAQRFNEIDTQWKKNSSVPKAAKKTPQQMVKEQETPQQVRSLTGGKASITKGQLTQPKKSTKSAVIEPTKPAQKPAEPSQSLVPVKKQKEKPTPAPTAHPVIDPKFVELVKRINALDEKTMTAGLIRDLSAELDTLVPLPDRASNSAYQQAKRMLDTKNDMLQQREQNQQILLDLTNVIEDIQGYTKNNKTPEDNADIVQWKRLLTKANRLPASEQQQSVITNFTAAITQYRQKLVGLFPKISQLHETINTTILEKSTAKTLESMQKIAETVASLHVIVPFAETDKIKVDLAVVDICATYDAMIYVLYMPELFNPLLKKIEDTKTDLESYQKFLGIVETYAEYIHNALEALKPLMTSSNKDLFDEGKWDITKLKDSLLKDGTYIYSIAVKTPVTIDTSTDPNLIIPTLQELDAFHVKDYVGAIKEWRARIDGNAHIEALRSIDPITLTPEKLEKLYQELAKLYNEMATLFETDEQLKKLFEEVSTKVEATEIPNLLAQLREQIEKAQTTFDTAKKITNIAFQKPLAEIKGFPNVNLFEVAIKEVEALLTKYLVSIAEWYCTQLQSFPARGYAAEVGLQGDIGAIKNISPTFMGMLNQLQALGYFTDIDAAGNLFNALYLKIMQGYGYVLATFDALTAKLHDGAVDKRGWLEFLAQKVAGTEKLTQYRSAMMIIEKLLKPLAVARTYYYEKLIEPYFTESERIKSYLRGQLNLMDLGLAGITKEDGTYEYARRTVAMKGSDDKTKAFIYRNPTGMHMRGTGMTAPTMHSGNEEYNEVIKEWSSQIKNLLDVEYAQEQNSMLQKKLQLVLDTPLGDPEWKSTSIFDPTKKPKYKNHFAIIHRAEDIHETVFGYLMRAYKEPATRAQMEEYLDLFFTSLKGRLSDPRIFELLGELNNDNKLDEDIRTQILEICGNGFALLDSLTKWGYLVVDGVKESDQQRQQQVRKFVGNMLAQYQPYMDDIIKILMKLAPYLPAQKSAEYTSQQGLPLSDFAPIQSAESLLQKLVEGGIEEKLNYRFALGNFNFITNTLDPVTVGNVSLLQNGYHTATTLQQSLKNLSTIIKKLGGKKAASDVLDTILDLMPLNTAFEQAELPYPDELIELTKKMGHVFKKIKERTITLGKKLEKEESLAELLKAASPSSPSLIIGDLLSETAYLLISAYYKEKTSDQKKAYMQLVSIFKSTLEFQITGEFAGRLKDALQHIVAGQPPVEVTKPIEKQKNPKPKQPTGPLTPGTIPKVEKIVPLPSKKN